MFTICKTALRFVSITGLVAGLAAGGTVLVAGKERAKAIALKVQHKVHEQIDSNIEDPISLRKQLMELEREYPDRIQQVRADLGSLHQQMDLLAKEREISDRVVALAENDLEVLEPLLDEVAMDTQDVGGASLVSLRFDDRVWEYNRAVARAEQIRETRMLHKTRAADADHNLNYLQAESERFEELLVELSTEQARFQAQIQQLNQQIDSIARNERLIEMLEERSKSYEECSRYKSVSLDQITSRLAEVRARQEAELDYLSSSRKDATYEDAARAQLESESAAERAYDRTRQGD